MASPEGLSQIRSGTLLNRLRGVLELASPITPLKCVVIRHPHEVQRGLYF